VGSVGQIVAAEAEPVFGESLRLGVMRFIAGASTEITAADEQRLPELAQLLPAGTAIYVAHTPSSTLSDIVRTALAAQRVGFTATPHIVARRIANALMLRRALAELRAGGVEQILLIAGDACVPMGEFSSTLDVLESDALEQSGMRRIAVAAHPEGHKAIGPTLLWEALQAKQYYAQRTGATMHIVTQFSFNAGVIREWESQLPRHQIYLPVHVGMPGPAPLSRLIRYAMQCGIGASLRTVMRNLSAVGSVAELAIRPEEHLVALVSGEQRSRIEAPHFFAFGGCIETAQWIQQVAGGAFDIDPRSGKMTLRS
jgi:methylenetetrahydrofolate reductase (NADPH)